LTKLAAALVPAGPINTPDADRAFAAPRVWHRRMVVELTDRDGDSIKSRRYPLKFAGRPLCEHAHPHRLGADAANILRELLGVPEDDAANILRELLGMPEDKVARLAKDGVVALG